MGSRWVCNLGFLMWTVHSGSMTGFPSCVWRRWEDRGSCYCTCFPMGDDSNGPIINLAQPPVSKVEADGFNGKTFRDAIIGSVVQVPEEAKFILVSEIEPESDGRGGNLGKPSTSVSNPDNNPPLLGKLDSLREAINKVIAGFPNEKLVEPPVIDNSAAFGSFNADPPPHSAISEAISQLEETKDKGFQEALASQPEPTKELIVSMNSRGDGDFPRPSQAIDTMMSTPHEANKLIDPDSVFYEIVPADPKVGKPNPNDLPTLAELGIIKSRSKH
ncbi:hypothetical protein SUGI_0301830 [Cryptomeria japonica]|nr:hypothetical protein SUGI_0301830 [Cryptomeria japonica]